MTQGCSSLNIVDECEQALDHMCQCQQSALLNGAHAVAHGAIQGGWIMLPECREEVNTANRRAQISAGTQTLHAHAWLHGAFFLVAQGHE